jgi:hypothetical protein
MLPIMVLMLLIQAPSFLLGVSVSSFRFPLVREQR